MPRFLRRPSFLALLVATFGLSAFVTAPGASGVATTSELTTSLASRGTGTDPLNDATGADNASSASANGRYVVFSTKASNAAKDYVHDAGNTGTDVFVRDGVANTTTLVSAKDGSTTAGANASSSNAVISADGRWVAFVSSATNLVAGQVANANPQVFLRDLKTGTTTYASAKTGSTTTGGDAAATGPSISADGSKIAFTSAATDVAASFVVGNAGKTNVFVRDRAAGTNALASPSRTDKNKGGDDSSTSSAGSVGADGRTVAFSSLATDLVADFVDNNGGIGADVYARDLVAGTTALTSGKGGSPSASSNGSSTAPAASSDGRAIAFQSTGTDLIGSFVDGNGGTGADVFLRDTEAQTTTLVSHKAGSALAGSNQESTSASISGDGRLVAFRSANNSDLGADGTPSAFDEVYVRNVNLDTIVRASVTSAGAAANGASYAPALALDGHSVVYATGAANLASPATTTPQVVKTQLINPGYWLDASDGGIFAFGPEGVTPPFYGSTGAMKLNQPMVGMAPYADGLGYWLVARDGGIFSFPAPGHTNLFFGSTGAIHLNQPIVGMAAFPNGKGYWLVASDGGIFTFGDTDFYKGKQLPFFGSTGAIKLNKPIVGMAAFPNGKGYWLVASDGGIFTFGDTDFYKGRQLPFFGSTGAITLNKPIVGLAAFPNGRGYWLVASDGGIFTFGDASYYTASFPLPFYGSTGAVHLNQPIVGMASTPTGMGYWLVASDGGIFAFGDAPFFGSTGAIHLNQPIVGMAAR
ncbi:MAG: hypothetical protein U0V73_16035 [Acidimicrobiia bacterium]